VGVEEGRSREGTGTGRKEVCTAKKAAAKKAAVKKKATRKTAPAAAQSATETGGQ